MKVTREYLLSLMPPDRDEWITIKDAQVVPDIIRQLVKQYPFSAPMYDLIGWCFDTGDVETICDGLFDFCVNNIRYRAEGIEWQSSSLPNGILQKAEGDCKAYASFIGGCLGAINRAAGAGIDWAFRFVSYDSKIRTPYHVFIVVFTPHGEIWVDPTPGTAGGKPLYPVTKKVHDVWH
jgi:hypothetical protein